MSTDHIYIYRNSTHSMYHVYAKTIREPQYMYLQGLAFQCGDRSRFLLSDSTVKNHSPH